jgi:7-carboxy-7-deazaguanine synthase
VKDLFVNNFYPTIQGEGCQTGQAMILLRLQGCDVGCPWCDTKETWAAPTQRGCSRDVANFETVKADNAYYLCPPPCLAIYFRQEFPEMKWVLVTGGEPAMQDLKVLVRDLHIEGFKAAVETSGTAAGHIFAEFDWVCVSPKIGMPGGRSIIPAAVAIADEIKFPIGREADIAQLDQFLATYPLKDGVEVCLQPLSQSPKATELCIKTVLERGWRLSAQVHKYLNLP